LSIQDSDFLLSFDREIIDESDVFIDVHKAIRRMAPAPRARVPRGKVVAEPNARKLSEQPLADGQTGAEENGSTAALRKSSLPEADNKLKPSFMLRRRSDGSRGTMEALRSDDPDVIAHLKHLGPSNAANRPKSTRINTVKIKPGQTPDIPNTIPENSQPRPESIYAQDSHAPEGGIGEGLLANAGLEASDGVHSLAVGYGTMAPNGDRMSWKSGRSGLNAAEDEPTSPKGSTTLDKKDDYLVVDNRTEDDASRGRSKSVSTIGSLHSIKSRSRSPPKKRHTARSGSISENVVDVNGIKKIVLETTSSSDSEDKALGGQADGGEDSQKHSEAESSTAAGGKGASKKKRKKRGKKKKAGGGDAEESQPLLG
jgi:metal transporter CNNM